MSVNIFLFLFIFFNFLFFWFKTGIHTNINKHMRRKSVTEKKYFSSIYSTRKYIQNEIKILLK